jgi:hypothetical protein
MLLLFGEKAKDEAFGKKLREVQVALGLTDAEMVIVAMLKESKINQKETGLLDAVSGMTNSVTGWFGEKIENIRDNANKAAAERKAKAQVEEIITNATSGKVPYSWD